MNWCFLRVEEVQAVQAKLIDDFGGSHGLRDAELLDSAVARARNKALYEKNVTVAMLAATLSYGLIKNHAFIDGNKRIGLAVLIAFLKVNAYFLDVAEDEAEAMVLRAAASEISEDEWTGWVERSTKLLP